MVHTTLTPEQLAFINYTKEQLKNYYEHNYIKPRSERKTSFDSEYESNVKPVNVHIFYDNSNNELLRAIFYRDNMSAIIHCNNDDEIIDENTIYKFLAKLVSDVLKSKEYYHDVLATLFHQFDEYMLLVYVLLKYSNELSNFKHREVYVGSSYNNAVIFDRAITYVEARTYLNKIGKNATSQSKSKSLLPSNIGDIVFPIDADFYGGRRKQKITLKLKRSTEKIHVQGKERLVYVGPKGGKYIKLNNKNVPLSRLT